MLQTDALKIQKPAGPLDGYEGGLWVVRDAYAVSGGKRGNTNHAIVSYTVAGKLQTSFEYSTLNWLRNFADAGENVACYNKASKEGAGPTWGVCSEVTDGGTPQPGAMIADETDVYCSGPDNGARIGKDVVVGDAKAGGSGAEATVGVRVSAHAPTPWARWLHGFMGYAYKLTGLFLQAPPEGAVRGIHIRGKHIVGIDLGEAECSGAAIRLPCGGRVTFEPTDQVGFGYNPAAQQFEIKIGATLLMGIALSGDVRIPGRLFVAGHQVGL